MTQKFQVIPAKVSDKKQAERDLQRHKENQKLATGLGSFYMHAHAAAKRRRQRTEGSSDIIVRHIGVDPGEQ